MSKPKISKFREDDGTVDHEAFDETMGDYEDEMYQEHKDRELEERNERTEEKERHADYSDQEKRND